MQDPNNLEAMLKASDQWKYMEKNLQQLTTKMNIMARSENLSQEKEAELQELKQHAQGMREMMNAISSCFASMSAGGQ